MGKKGVHTKRQLARQHREDERAAKASAAERSYRTKRQDRQERKVDAALRGCRDV